MMIASRKKGQYFLSEFSNNIENRTSTPVPLERLRGKRPQKLPKNGITLRFINALFHQEMRPALSKLKNTHDIATIDSRNKLPHHKAWEKMMIILTTSNDKIDEFAMPMGKRSFFENSLITETTPSDFDNMDEQDLYLLYEYIV